MDSELNTFFEILKTAIPALIVFLTAYFLLKDMMENAQKQREFEFRIQNQGQITPIRLQAYERLTLFLERIAPQSLLSRISPHGKTAIEYHRELIQQIKQEYQHNLSQQIYISPTTWEVVRGAKESLISTINQAANKIDKESSAILLHKQIFEAYLELDEQPITIALETIKKEVQKLF